MGLYGARGTYRFTRFRRTGGNVHDQRHQTVPRQCGLQQSCQFTERREVRGWGEGGKRRERRGNTERRTTERRLLDVAVRLPTNSAKPWHTTTNSKTNSKTNTLQPYIPAAAALVTHQSRHGMWIFTFLLFLLLSNTLLFRPNLLITVPKQLKLVLMYRASLNTNPLGLVLDAPATQTQHRRRQNTETTWSTFECSKT